MCISPPESGDGAPVTVKPIAPAATQLYPADSRSFLQQFKDLKGTTDLDVLDRGPYPKPSLAALSSDPRASAVPGSDGVYTCSVDRPLLKVNGLRTLTPEQVIKQQEFSFFWRKVGFFLVHATFFWGCWFTFSWYNLALGLAWWVVTICFGINMCYHRLLAHRSFKTYKPVERLLAYFALQAMQGPPIEWVSNHRYHHLHCDTPLDLHSPYEGFFHAHMGWLFDKADVERPYLDRANVTDISADWFYRLLEATWVPQMLARMFLTWGFFGYDKLVWTMAFPIMWGWHETFCVNSVAHLWGRQPYDTGDLSRNNWFVAMISFGEGWHNSHHAFPSSARHGLEWWEVDVCYYCICAMKALALAWDVRLPSQRDKDRKRQPDQKQKVF